MDFDQAGRESRFQNSVYQFMNTIIYLFWCTENQLNILRGNEARVVCFYFLWVLPVNPLNFSLDGNVSEIVSDARAVEEEESEIATDSTLGI